VGLGGGAIVVRAAKELGIEVGDEGAQALFTAEHAHRLL
jgi:hypothetical protein